MGLLVATLLILEPLLDFWPGSFPLKAVPEVWFEVVEVEAFQVGELRGLGPCSGPEAESK